MKDIPICEGYLEKKNVLVYWEQEDNKETSTKLVPLMTKYKKRFFFVEEDDIWYLKSHKDEKPNAKRLVKIQSIEGVEMREKKKYSFCIKCTGVTHILKATSKEEMNK